MSKTAEMLVLHRRSARVAFVVADLLAIGLISFNLISVYESLNDSHILTMSRESFWMGVASALFALLSLAALIKVEMGKRSTASDDIASVQTGLVAGYGCLLVLVAMFASVGTTFLDSMNEWILYMYLVMQVIFAAQLILLQRQFSMFQKRAKALLSGS